MADRIVLAHRISESDTNLNPFTSLHDTIVFSSADWGAARDLAWIYGIVVGWDCEDPDEDEDEDSALDALARKFGWSDVQVQRLRRLRDAFVTAASQDQR